MPPAAPPPQPGRVARAATRYRPGKAPVGAQDLLDSDSEEEERQDEREKHEEEEAPQSITSINFAKPRQTAGIVIQQQQGSERTRKLDLLLDQKRSTAGRKGEEEEGEESSEYETDTDEEPQKPVFRPQGARNLPKVGVTAKVEEEASSEYETDSEEESSEEEVKPMLKPLFVPNQRKTVNALEDEQKVAEIAESKAEKEAEIRRKEAHLLAADRIKRELLEKQHEESKPDLDDTDGKDPEEEFQAWRLRELERINRDREAAAERQREKEEIEKRREMPEEQKLREDMERAKKSREEKSRGKQGFMQRYYHKGAFYQDLDILKKHDYTEKTENAIDYSLLPKSMQVKNFGRASRSKYTLSILERFPSLALSLSLSLSPSLSTSQQRMPSVFLLCADQQANLYPHHSHQTMQPPGGRGHLETSRRSEVCRLGWCFLLTLQPSGERQQRRRWKIQRRGGGMLQLWRGAHEKGLPRRSQRWRQIWRWGDGNQRPAGLGSYGPSQ
ncbi:hypothetical protein IE53DRAFT_145144 [Violaceomyces palustris]|uniref:Uncharacterized protein n=1 Tax=Violaceomyces palustris TaxID=1673888 RepID=A0ACD0P5Z5_9BASI|nr:hypothetical protein IE53DRAFT_145144 [Violaceomyces palustris]